MTFSSLAAPTGECLHPAEFEVEAPGAAEREVGALLSALVACLKARVVIETGTGEGVTSRAIAAALAANGVGRLVTLDVYARRSEALRRALGDASGFVEAVTADATTFAWGEHLRGELVDLAFIDGGLDREGEARNVLPFVRPGGVVAFHDTGVTLAPRLAVTNLVAEGLLTQPFYVPVPRGLTLTRTPGGERYA